MPLNPNHPSILLELWDVLLCSLTYTHTITWTVLTGLCWFRFRFLCFLNCFFSFHVSGLAFFICSFVYSLLSWLFSISRSKQVYIEPYVSSEWVRLSLVSTSIGVCVERKTPLKWSANCMRSTHTRISVDENFQCKIICHWTQMFCLSNIINRKKNNLVC